MKQKYVVHQYQVFNDKLQRPNILTSTDVLSPIFHFENFNLVQYTQASTQSFNKKQYFLHCTV